MSQPASQSESVFRHAGIASFAVLLSRISGLVREGVMSRLFGAGAAMDAFIVGFRIPNLTRDLFAEGALSAAFIPTFVDYLNKKSKEEAAHLVNLVATAIILLVGSLCVLGIFASPWLVALVTGHWVEDAPEKYTLAVRLTQVMFPFLLLVALAAQAMGVLNSLNQFTVPAFSSTWFNVGSVVFGVLLGFVAGPHIGLARIEGMAIGVVIGGALQLLWQIPSLYRAGFRFRFAFDWNHPGLRHIFHLMGPAILGGASVQINVLVNTVFATSIDDPIRGVDGPVAWLGYAFRFMQLPLGLFGVAIATATLPAIGRSASSGNMEEFRETLARSLGLVFLLTVPSSVGLILLGPSIVGAIYEGAKFQPYDTQQTARALSFFAIGLAGYAATKVLVPAFYALKDSRTPMYVSIASIAINAGMGYSLVRIIGMGHSGLALATSAVALFSFFVLFWLMKVRIGGVYGRRLRSVILKVTLASAVMGAAVWGSSRFIQSLAGIAPMARLIDLAITIPLGIAILYFVCRALRVEELAMAVNAVGGPIARRFSALNAKLVS
ncbi:MAG: murein biosynthesis integral membrane protein MurJ [Bryobacteraceae bacterium]|nr:murein biosynthesis integral membrane protein MurJ [Solibacteraceae bacterium]MCO5351695.1 murein biosynthesis integral membrane protein MurJ [Bryobacteraceae bacterium]